MCNSGLIQATAIALDATADTFAVSGAFIHDLVMAIVLGYKPERFNVWLCKSAALNGEKILQSLMNGQLQTKAMHSRPTTHPERLSCHTSKACIQMTGMHTLKLRESRAVYRLAEEETLPRSQMLESKWLAKSLLNFISRNKGQRVAALFDLLSIFTTRTRVSFHFLKAFLAERLPQEYTVEEQRKVRSLVIPSADKGGVTAAWNLQF